MIDGLRGDEQLPGDLGVGPAVQIRSSTSCSRRVSPSGWARVAVRGPAGMDRMPSSRIFCRATRAVAVAPRSAKICRASRSASSSRLRQQGQRRLVRAAQVRPQARPPAQSPSSSALVGLGEVAARRPGRAGAPQPDRDRAAIPGVVPAARRRPARPRAAASPAVPPASTPRRGPAAPARSAAARRSRRRAHRLVEILPDAWLAPAGPDQAEPVQRVEPVDRGRAAPAQQLRLSATASSQRPVRSRQLVRSPRRQMRSGDVMLVAVGDAVGEVPLGFGESPLPLVAARGS